MRLAMADSCKVVRSGSEAVLAETPLLRETRLEDGLIVVPGFPDAELLRPSASGFSEGGQITSDGRRRGFVRRGIPADRDCSTPRSHSLGASSVRPGRSVETTGKPAAMASIREIGRPSSIDESTKRSRVERKPGTLRLAPWRNTRFAMPSDSAV